MRLPYSLATVILLASIASAAPHHELDPDCSDWDPSCYGWVARNHSYACKVDTVVQKNCKRSCHICGPEEIEPRFDIRNLPRELESLAFLVGKWRSEFGGKAFFPTIPRFTYGEQLEFSISDRVEGKVPSLNYTAFAWDPNDLVELHSENGYLIVNNTHEEVPVVEMNTAMSNGFMTIEQGDLGTNQIHFRLLRIGRISFSHDSAVRVVSLFWATVYLPTVSTCRFAFVFLSSSHFCVLTDARITASRVWITVTRVERINSQNVIARAGLSVGLLQ